MSAPVSTKPEEGLWVLHLFCHAPTPTKTDSSTQANTLKKANLKKAIQNFSDGETNQLITISILGHKADIAFMALSKSATDLKALQNAVAASGLKISDSYLSLTEISEYATQVPEEMKMARLYPELSTKENKVWIEKPIWSFYPMSKRRDEKHNWFALPYEERERLMHEHGSSGRKFKGRVLQVITSSTGIDDYEWGVTLFCTTPTALKEVVYTLRFDEASAKYAKFGAFYTGFIDEPEKLIDSL